MSIAINRYGNINTKGLPVCELNDIQPATTADALAVCRKSLVGEGTFTADVPSSGRAPFPSEGKLYAFNGVVDGTPGDPRPRLRRAAGADLLHPRLPDLEERWDLRHHAQGRPAEARRPAERSPGSRWRSSKTFKSHGKKQSYVTGSCPAPKGVKVAGFPFAKASFAFSDGRKVNSTLNRSCSVRGK